MLPTVEDILLDIQGMAEAKRKIDDVLVGTVEEAAQAMTLEITANINWDALPVDPQTCVTDGLNTYILDDVLKVKVAVEVISGDVEVRYSIRIDVYNGTTHAGYIPEGCYFTKANRVAFIKNNITGAILDFLLRKVDISPYPAGYAVASVNDVKRWLRNNFGAPLIRVAIPKFLLVEGPVTRLRFSIPVDSGSMDVIKMTALRSNIETRMKEQGMVASIDRGVIILKQFDGGNLPRTSLWRKE